MKKIICILLTLIMLIPTVTFGADTSNYEEILSLVKQRFSIDNSYEVFESSTQERYGQTIYSFYWSTKGDNPKTLSVDCDQNGIVRNYHSYIRNNEDNFGIKKYTPEQYQKASQDLADFVNPSLKGKITVNEIDTIDLYGNNVFASLSYVENGVKVREFSGSLSLDANNLSLINYNFSIYKDLKYPTSFIDLETAKQAYKDLFGMELVYEISYKDDVKTPVAKYVLGNNSNQYINAVDGKLYTYSPSYIYNSFSGSADSENLKSEFSEAEMKEITNINGLLSKEQIEKSVKEIKILNIPKDATTYYSNLVKVQGRYVYNLGYEKYNITVDGKTGAVISFNNYSGEGNYKDTPENYAKLLAGKLFEEYKVAESENTLRLQRYVNDVKVLGDTITVSVDKETGILTNYNIAYTDAQFPSVENVITKDEALKIVFENVNYDKIYIAEISRDAIFENAVMVYSFENESFYVNPYDGEFVNNFIAKKEIKYNDIDNHYAKNQIETLAQYGIGFETDSFNPDNFITQKDFITLLVSAFGGGQNEIYERTFVSAKNYNIIKDSERNDDAFVTRTDALVFLARANGSDKYAQMENIWKCPFKDVTENVGYVCIMYGMGIINGDEKGNFNPEQNITKADSAIIICNSLKK
ncbi:MAG: S-layer homology domain-containing protein [Clostridia bacterium]|nr:S-layer homology domain-containing protein [Clostridia bacterium]MBQ4543113.1 S-layer homology domain-containing protein [Clostridia bacterium]